MFVTMDNLPAFRRAYKAAVKRNESEFSFEGSPVVVDYAKYLIQYFDATVKLHTPSLRNTSAFFPTSEGRNNPED